MKIKIASFLLIFSLLITGCAAAKSTYDAAPAMGVPYPESPIMESFVEESGESYRDDVKREGSSGVYENPVQRIVIRNAQLSIVVDDPAAAMESIGKMAERMGGFIVSSTSWKTRNYQGVEVPEASINVRVPAESLDDALKIIKDLLKDKQTDLLNEEITGQDVTKEYTDLNSRLRNLEDAEAQLKIILDDAKKTEDVLDVFQELTYYREQIEVTKGQIKYYEESAALSSIMVRIQAHEAVNPITIAGWKPSVTISKAVQALINALQNVVDGIIWVVIVFIPVLALVLLPFYLLFLIIRALVRKNKAKKLAKTVKQEEEK